MKALVMGDARDAQREGLYLCASMRTHRLEINTKGRVLSAIRRWSSPLQTSNVRSKLMGSLAAAICVLGIGLRLYIYFVNRSLWGDEAKVALNLIHRSFSGLLLTLDYAQVAPVGFLMLEKGVISAFGSVDLVLRIVPLMAGVIAVPLMYIFSRRMSAGLVPMLSLGLFAVTTSLIYYSSELKQYSSDVLAALVLLLAASQVADESDAARPLMILGLAGFLAMWISHPAVFVLAGIFLSLGLSSVQRRQWRGLLYLSGVGALLAISGVLEYFVSLRQSARDPLLTGYWQWSFAPTFSPSTATWYLAAFKGWLQDPGGLPFGLAIVTMFAAGLISLAIRRWQLLVLLTTPILFALLASALKLYPFTGRFLLFTMPMLVVVVSEGLDRLRTLLMTVHPPTAILASVVGCGFLLYQPLATTYSWIQSPPRRDDIKPALAYVTEHRQDSDVIYVYYYGTPQFLYYAPFYGLDHNPNVQGVYSRDDPAGYLKDIDSLVGNRRVWFIFSHNYRSGKVNEQLYFLSHLDSLGVKQAEFYAPGVAVFLYDLSRTP